MRTGERLAFLTGVNVLCLPLILQTLTSLLFFSNVPIGILLVNIGCAYTRYSFLTILSQIPGQIDSGSGEARILNLLCTPRTS